MPDRLEETKPSVIAVDSQHARKVRQKSRRYGVLGQDLEIRPDINRRTTAALSIRNVLIIILELYTCSEYFANVILRCSEPFSQHECRHLSLVRTYRLITTAAFSWNI